MKTRAAFFRDIGLAAISGGMYSLAFPPLGWRWLAIVGIAVLLFTLRGHRGSRARLIGFVHGMAAFGVGLSWLLEIFGGVAVALWVILALFPALFAEMQARAEERGFSGWSLAAFTALNWCGWEFIRAELFPLKFPWMSAGLAAGPNTLVPWVGVYVSGLLIVFAAALLAQRMWKAAAIPVAAMAASTVFWKPLNTPSQDDPAAVKVAGVQLEDVSLDPYLDATRAFPAGIDLVVWPEYSIPYDIQTNKRDWALLLDLAKEKNITLTVGTQVRSKGSDEWRNIALTLDQSGARGEHTKIHAVHFFDDGTPGKIAAPVMTDHGKIGTPICFDCDYEDVIRKMTAAGAEFIVAPTMDAMKWMARQHDQHAELYRMRACENGRWIFSVATSGVSQIIDPRGHVHRRLDAMAQGTLSGILARESRLTFYTRAGWLAPWCVLGLAGIGWLVLLLPRRKPPVEQVDQS